MLQGLLEQKCMDVGEDEADVEGAGAVDVPDAAFGVDEVDAQGVIERAFWVGGIGFAIDRLVVVGEDRLECFAARRGDEAPIGRPGTPLRHLGIPTRMATGYAPGNFDGKDTFIVKESSAHTWPEVYFPAYGWVEFEPTPSQLASTHGPVPEASVADPTTVATPNSSPTPDETGLHKPLNAQTIASIVI